MTYVWKLSIFDKKTRKINDVTCCIDLFVSDYRHHGRKDGWGESGTLFQKSEKYLLNNFYLRKFNIPPEVGETIFPL